MALWVLGSNPGPPNLSLPFWQSVLPAMQVWTLLLQEHWAQIPKLFLSPCRSIIHTDSAWANAWEDTTGPNTCTCPGIAHLLSAVPRAEAWYYRRAPVCKSQGLG